MREDITTRLHYNTSTPPHNAGLHTCDIWDFQWISVDEENSQEDKIMSDDTAAFVFTAPSDSIVIILIAAKLNGIPDAPVYIDNVTLTGVTLSQRLICMTDEEMAQQNLVDSRYRFGFNGQEKVNEVYGEANYLNFDARGYDPRRGQFLSLDPLRNYVAYESNYLFAGNSPILSVDVKGEYQYSDANKVNFAENYKIFTKYLSDYIESDIMRSAYIKDGLIIFGQYKNEDNIRQDVSWNHGPYINITTKPGGLSNARGKYHHETQTIDINIEFVKQFEEAFKSGDMKKAQAALMSLYRLILHETTHHGDHTQTPPDGDVVLPNDTYTFPDGDTWKNVSRETGYAFDFYFTKGAVIRYSVDVDITEAVKNGSNVLENSDFIFYLNKSGRTVDIPTVPAQ